MNERELLGITTKKSSEDLIFAAFQGATENGPRGARWRREQSRNIRNLFFRRIQSAVFRRKDMRTDALSGKPTMKRFDDHLS